VTMTPPYRVAVGVLAQYEGVRAYLRVASGALPSLVVAAIPLGIIAVSVYVVRGGAWAFAVDVVSLFTASLPFWAFKARLWERLVRERLDRWTAYDATVPRVSVNVAQAHADASCEALRHAGLVLAFTRLNGAAAPGLLGYAIDVARPAFLRLRSTSSTATRFAMSSGVPGFVRTLAALTSGLSARRPNSRAWHGLVRRAGLFGQCGS
jgi:hypothetical protein